MGSNEGSVATKKFHVGEDVVICTPQIISPAIVGGAEIERLEMEVIYFLLGLVVIYLAARIVSKAYFQRVITPTIND